MFLNELYIEELSNGKKRLEKPLVWETESDGVLVVPALFVTDYDSIPRIPFIYALFKGLPAKPCVLHDYLYTSSMPRKKADKIFLKALREEGVGYLKSYMAYLGVRSFGWSHKESK